MSIWVSLPLGDGVYLDFVDGTGHYTVNDPKSLASTPTGGFFDVATSNLCDLIRVCVQDESVPDSVQVWLDRDQARTLATEILKRVPPCEP